jgi:acetylornithine deacetylase/succinyl-diaminopimelate desuccinylase-like protein
MRYRAADLKSTESLVRSVVGFTFLTLASTCALAATEIDRDALAAEAVERLQNYIKVDTVNPPGNEVRGAEYLGAILDREGIDYATAESAPGRANLWARLGGGTEPAVVLLHHIDVVPADAKFWSVDPLSGEERDGYIYGRGALDTKSLGIMHLQAFIALARAGKALRRPVIFMATADEEAGGTLGAGWIVENRARVFADATLLLNEGGAGLELDDGRIVNVEVTQKVPLWLRLTTQGKAGHGSRPGVASSVTRLVEVLDRLARHEFEPRIVPAVEAYLQARAEAGVGPFSDRLAHLDQALEDRDFRIELKLADPQLSALTQDTCAITRLSGSNKINVIPPSASAELDCRLLPDQDPARFIDEIRAVAAEPDLEIETLLAFTPAVSTTDTELFAAIESVSKRHYPDAAVLPAVSVGFTDSHFFRDLGMVAYGYSPIMLPLKESPRFHGNDERISVENMRRGTVMMLELLEQLVY